MSDATILLTSRINDKSGTGFVIHTEEEQDRSFVVTCAHVIKALGETAIGISNYSASLVNIGDPYSDDLAVLQITPRYPAEPVRVASAAALATSNPQRFVLEGFPLAKVTDESGKRVGWEKRVLRGSVSAAIGRVSRHDSASVVPAWDFVVDSSRSNGEQLNEGYSGAAVAKENGEVFGVVSYKLESGTKGAATSIAALPSIWKTMPASLLERICGATSVTAEATMGAAAGGGGARLVTVKKEPMPSLPRRITQQIANLRPGIGKIKGYKELHDILHTIQRTCLEQIELELRSWHEPQDPPDVGVYSTRCEGLLAQMKQRLPDLALAANETDWITRELEPAVRSLHQAVESGCVSGMKTAKTRLAFVLETQMPALNQVLHAESKALPLAELRISLRAESEANPTAKRLLLLLEQLESLIEIHNKWQILDRRIRLITAQAPTSDLADLTVLWNIMREQTKSLCDTRGEYGNSLLGLVDKLDGAISTSDLARVHASLRNFGSSAGDAFFRVDADLKNNVTEIPELLRVV